MFKFDLGVNHLSEMLGIGVMSGFVFLKVLRAVGYRKCDLIWWWEMRGTTNLLLQL